MARGRRQLCGRDWSTGSFWQMIRLVRPRLAALILAAALRDQLMCCPSCLGRPLQGLATAMEAFETERRPLCLPPCRRHPGGARSCPIPSATWWCRIQRLMSTVREEEVNLRKTELKALQAQINPHFLYNTLDSIAWMCEQRPQRRRGADGPCPGPAVPHQHQPGTRAHPHRQGDCSTPRATCKFRNTATKTSSPTHFTVDPRAAWTTYCNKITLQPIIENAIVHGLDLMVEDGHIEITVCPDGGRCAAETSATTASAWHRSR